ncbi:hypothetical protein [Halovivax gelatinilyticus]|uniref:hypothetical protein n=1 Tax=Halovivax gelatinilyticus TaxID=2961597 RepID=UPI0020CA8B3A|nr:hypothetical protein [Halovivax gelatinilyticus]
MFRRLERRVANPLIRSILRSRAHWIVSGRLALVSYVGRHSGRRYTFPVAYHERDGAIVAMTPKRETDWWRTFRTGRECRVWLRGTQFPATGSLVTDDDRASLIAGYVERHRLLGRLLGVESDPNPRASAEANDHLAVVRFDRHKRR